ncbi:MAG: 50S ribosomal protein L18 [Flavobacteriales bacterium]|jgi:large subunit ribosomal protein L18|uniref:50S ribosomal protein L18 n=1 Tax=Blattabacterium sp. (Mastotermes darwiniensis) TaxID=39768 RepID=UPI000231DE63|nr:50S ribosomal protein L18 [Blattabacterium sp. (Mastotermes darwiniensis)]AER40663.1 50S ribosomal protein L18 [Blattabacterium sp. (Mastotermes darwiniensis) str. MADAR]MDR1804809.1 50S ribosomal protein L18 [Flavobacteriales bacterium]
MEKRRILKKIFGTPKRPRISVFRSNKAIYVQIIDDLSGRTLVSSSSREKIFKNCTKTKKELSNEVGKLLGQRAKTLNIQKVVFDKGRYLYHGRVKSLVEGIREMGLDF